MTATPTVGVLRTITNLGVNMAVGTLMVFVVGVLAPFLVDALDLSVAQVGALPSAFFLAAALTSPRAGRIADRMGARRTLLLLDAMVAAALALLALAPGITVAAGAALLAGAATALGNPATNRVVADVVPAGARGIAMGTKQAGVPAGSVLAGALLPTIAEAWGWRIAALSAAVLPALGALLAWTTRSATAIPPSPTPAQVPETVVGDRGLRRVRTFAFLMGGASGLVNTFLVLYANEVLGFTTTAAGMVAAVMGAVAVVFRIAWAHVGERHVSSPTILLTVGVAGAAASALTAISSTLGAPSVWVAAVLAGASIIAFHGVMNLLIVQLRPATDVGHASGFVLRGFFLGLLLTPILFGATVDAAGTFLWVWLGQATLCLAATVSVARWSAADRAAAATASVPTPS